MCIHFFASIFFRISKVERCVLHVCWYKCFCIITRKNIQLKRLMNLILISFSTNTTSWVFSESACCRCEVFSCFAFLRFQNLESETFTRLDYFFLLCTFFCWYCCCFLRSICIQFLPTSLCKMRTANHLFLSCKPEIENKASKGKTIQKHLQRQKR